MSNSDNVIPFSGKKAEKPKDRPLSDFDDDELMLLARGGVVEAFDSLVKRHQDAVYRVAAKVLGPIPLASDAAQNTFLAIYSQMNDYRPQGKFRSFMFRILINQCRLFMRSVVRDKRLREGLSILPARLPATPDEELLEMEKTREVEHALRRLKYKHRIVMVLRFATDLSYKEISEVLKIPIGTVKSRIFTGIMRMRTIMKGKET